jgi:hypothetical protein
MIPALALLMLFQFAPVAPKPVTQPPTVSPAITAGPNITDAGPILIWEDKDSHGCTTPFHWDDEAKVCRITLTFTVDEAISCTFDPKTVSVACTYKPKNTPKPK